MSFPDSDIIGRIEEKLHDMEWDEQPHHEYCPMATKMLSTACFCKQLHKADRDAAAEAKMDLEDGR